MASFDEFKSKILDIEGGFVNNPLDPGGATNKGITFDTFQLFPIDYDHNGIINVSDLKLITDSWAQHIFKIDYWDELKADQIIDQSFADLIVDHAINAGPVRAIKMLQYLLNIPIDGIMGNQTLTTLNNALKNNGKALFDQYKLLRQNYYLYRASQPLTVPSFKGFLSTITSPNATQQHFIDGWLDRVSKFNWSGVVKYGPWLLYTGIAGTVLYLYFRKHGKI